MDQAIRSIVTLLAAAATAITPAACVRSGTPGGVPISGRDALNVATVWAVRQHRSCPSRSVQSIQSALRVLQLTEIRRICKCGLVDRAMLLRNIDDKSRWTPSNVEIVSFREPATFGLSSPAASPSSPRHIRVISGVREAVVWAPKDIDATHVALHIYFGKMYAIAGTRARLLYGGVFSNVDFLGLRFGECRLADPTYVPKVI